MIKNSLLTKIIAFRIIQEDFFEDYNTKQFDLETEKWFP